MNKPVTFVPTLPEPTQTVKRRRSTKTILAAQCKVCHRGTDPGNNRIVFCDSCNTAYHQYCHDPPINNEVVNVLEKEWLCGPCDRSKQNVIEGTSGLVAAEGLSIDEVCLQTSFITLTNVMFRNEPTSQLFRKHAWYHYFSMLPYDIRNSPSSPIMSTILFPIEPLQLHQSHQYPSQYRNPLQYCLLMALQVEPRDFSISRTQVAYRLIPRRHKFSAE